MCQQNVVPDTCSELIKITMAPKKFQKSQEAKGPACSDEEKAVHDVMKQHAESMNNGWEELGNRARAGEGIVKEEEVQSFLKRT